VSEGNVSHVGLYRETLRGREKPRGRGEDRSTIGLRNENLSAGQGRKEKTKTKLEAETSVILARRGDTKIKKVGKWEKDTSIAASLHNEKKRKDFRILRGQRPALASVRREPDVLKKGRNRRRTSSKKIHHPTEQSREKKREQ